MSSIKTQVLGTAVLSAAKKDFSGFSDAIEKVFTAKMQARVDQMVADKKETLFQSTEEE